MESKIKIALVGAGMFGGDVHLRAYADLQRSGISPCLGRVGLDDWARDLALEGEPPAPLASADPSGHVVYVRSLTKPAAPGLRVAALSARGAAFARLKAARTAEDFYVAGPLQEAALQLVTAPSWRRHLKAMRAALRERRDALVRAALAHFGEGAIPLVPAGGFHLWVKLPEGVSDEALASRALQASLVVSPGGRWFPAEAPGAFLRLTFAGAPAEELARAAGALGRLAAGAGDAARA